MRAPARRRRTALRRKRLWALLLAGCCLVGYLYYRPVKDYLQTSRQLAARRAEVKALAHEKAALERRLAASASGRTLIEEARRLGYVKPGEHLFVVRGIRSWLKAHEHHHGAPGR
ncbi:MAG TPA: septum formation initiator family protein [Gaiellaceae bacterium]|nr:septum formation initiator family protein [Gaiellaceae bacterium]